MTSVRLIALVLAFSFGLVNISQGAVRLTAHGGIKKLGVDDAIMIDEAKGHYMFGGSLLFSLGANVDLGVRADYLMYTDTNTTGSELKLTSLPLFGVISLHSNGAIRFTLEAGAGYAVIGKYTFGETVYKGSNFAAIADLKVGWVMSSWFMPYIEGGYMMNSWGEKKLINEADSSLSANPTAKFNYGGLYSALGFSIKF